MLLRDDLLVNNAHQYMISVTSSTSCFWITFLLSAKLNHLSFGDSLSMTKLKSTFLHLVPKPYCSEQVISSFKDQAKEDGNDVDKAKEADNNFILDDNSR